MGSYAIWLNHGFITRYDAIQLLWSWIYLYLLGTNSYERTLLLELNCGGSIRNTPYTLSDDLVKLNTCGSFKCSKMFPFPYTSHDDRKQLSYGINIFRSHSIFWSTFLNIVPKGLTTEIIFFKPVKNRCLRRGFITEHWLFLSLHCFCDELCQNPWKNMPLKILWHDFITTWCL